MVVLKIQKLHPDAILPHYSREGDAAMDLYSIEDVTIKPKERVAVGTGIATEFDKNHVLLYRDRSGLAFKHGITALGGVFDSNYRGEHKVILLNTGDEAYTIHKGDRIVQFIVLEKPHIEIEEVTDLSDSNRGENGFGSSGK
ncbi:MAG: dUTP diphosphatase [Candidatus Woesearchaeota archaeon]